jgi:Peptidase_C39 like family
MGLCARAAGHSHPRTFSNAQELDAFYRQVERNVAARDACAELFGEALSEREEDLAVLFDEAWDRTRASPYLGSRGASEATVHDAIADRVWGEEAAAFHLDRNLSFTGDRITSPEIRFARPMNQAVVSWNAVTPGESAIEVRLRAKRESGSWTAWFTMGVWGEKIRSRSTPGQASGAARIDDHLMIVEGGARVWQYEVVARHGSKGEVPSLHTMALAARDSRRFQKQRGTSDVRAVPLAVPPISQFEEGRKGRRRGLGARICAPASVAMVLQHAGVRVPSVIDLALQVYDPSGRVFGNWSFNVAALFRALHDRAPSHPPVAYVRWYDSFDELLAHVRKGHPVIVSVGFRRRRLDSSAKTARGHVLLVRGADQDTVYVNDPAVRVKRDVPRSYPRDAFVKAWKGMAYVVER